jgi:aminopeptidase 2
MTAPDQSAAGKQRLPTNIYPTHYDIIIKTDLAADPPIFLAEAVISLEASSDDKEVTFNVDPSIKITHLALESNGSTVSSLDVSTIDVDKEWQTATVDLSSVGGIKAGEAKLFVRWEAPLGTNMMGYYKSVGTPDENGKRPV